MQTYFQRMKFITCWRNIALFGITLLTGILLAMRDMIPATIMLVVNLAILFLHTKQDLDVLKEVKISGK